MSQLFISDLGPDDLPEALELNNAAVPAVNGLDLDALSRLVTMAAHAFGLRLRSHPGLAGFCLAFTPGAAYESPNYRWFGARYESFTYLDRIVVDARQRGHGLGTAGYSELERRIDGSTPWLFCEVNIRPMNAGSLRFHHRLGFVEVGQQDTNGGHKTVSLLGKPLTPRPPIDAR